MENQIRLYMGINSPGAISQAMAESRDYGKVLTYKVSICLTVLAVTVHLTQQ